MRFASTREIAVKAATNKTYVREAVAAEKGRAEGRDEAHKNFPVPEELREKFRIDPRFNRLSSIFPWYSL